MSVKISSKEYIVILDKRNNNVLDFNGHSVDPTEYMAIFMRFCTEFEAEEEMKEICDFEDLDINNYEVRTIKIDYNILGR